MSKERTIFMFECRVGGTLYWNKNSGNEMYPIFCPYSGETCHITCPHIIADEGLTFNCGPHSAVYRGKWKNAGETEEDHA